MAENMSPGRVKQYGGKRFEPIDANGQLPGGTGSPEGKGWDSDALGRQVSSNTQASSSEVAQATNTPAVITVDSGAQPFQFLEAAAGNAINALLDERPQLRDALKSMGLSGQGIVDYFVRAINRRRAADSVAMSPLCADTPINAEVYSELVDAAESADFFLSIYQGRKVNDLSEVYDYNWEESKVCNLIVMDAARQLAGGFDSLIKLRLALAMPDAVFNRALAMQGVDGVADYMSNLPERAARLRLIGA